MAWEALGRYPDALGSFGLIQSFPAAADSACAMQLRPLEGSPRNAAGKCSGSHACRRAGALHAVNACCSQMSILDSRKMSVMFSARNP